jgi:hypothetical protein
VYALGFVSDRKLMPLKPLAAGPVTQPALFPAMRAEFWFISNTP